MSSLVSIIIPCYNQGEFLNATIKSIVNQSFVNWECLLINDGSTDNTEEIVKQWSTKDSRIKYFYKKNEGLSSARNLGLDRAKGDYIQFLDSDDVLHSSKLKVSIDLFKNHSIDIAISNFNVFSSIEKLLPPYCILSQELFNFDAILYKWDSSFTIPIHCGLFKGDLFTNFRFPEHLKAKEDWIMWVSLFKDKKSKVLYINKPLALYRRNIKGMTKSSNMLPEYLKAIEYLKTILNDDEFEKLYLELISRHFKHVDLLKNRLQDVKVSNSYQTGLMIKKALKFFGLLKFFRKIFPFFLKFKSQN